ncbi:uncharacterized protein N7459_009298 [Penicillium hispanicum]|uniref:uncharacterized protein n=1 Tax=Penicillium hispanicum TaxID=1080232 RepID=UPI002541E5BF|nr:uncharacterized protein N7459_009298 [Penicillium hispanicum]KAJ5569868.1 hypothetical protein N7459_009298 [Penicillium hispanicum]
MRKGPLYRPNTTSLSDQKQPESFTHMLRRRFSRESKPSGEHREFSRFQFPFSLKSSRSFTARPGAELTALEDYGSSLMSERGYDSDAQYISTPQRSDHLARSPASRGLGRLELSDLVEQSQERNEVEQWAMRDNRNISESQRSAFGMRFIPTPPQSVRNARTAFHAPSASGDGEYAQGQPMSNMNFVRSLPSLHSVNRELGTMTTEPSSADMVYNDSNEQNIMADWKRFLKTSRQRYGFASSESLTDPPRDIVVHKTRQAAQTPHPSRSFTDPHSIHLNELGISNRLASQSASAETASRSPSLAELLRKNKFGLSMSSSQGNVRSRQNTAMSADLGPGLRSQATVQRDASSCYSRQESLLSANASADAQSAKMTTRKVQSSKAEGMERLGNGSASVNNVPAPDSIVLSRFREHCDSGTSKSLGLPTRSNGTGDLGSPRKVSVGWMSNGRRVGYGYSLVSDSEGEQQCQPESTMVQSPGRKAEIVTAMEGIKKGRSASQGHPGDYEQVAASTSQEHGSYLVTNHSHRPEREAATLPRAASSVQPIKGYIESPYLRGIIGNGSSRDQEPTPVPVKEENGAGHQVTELRPMIKSEPRQVSQNSQYKNRAGDNVGRRWARLSRTMSAQPRVRKDKEDRQKTWVIGAPYPVTRRDAVASSSNEEDTVPEFLDAENHDENEDQASELQRNDSRAAKWALRFSKYRESKRLSSFHRQEPSQASSGGYQDCESSSLKRTTSTRSNATEDQECLQMPGSFEGSRWASRISRMF